MSDSQASSRRAIDSAQYHATDHKVRCHHDDSRTHPSTPRSSPELYDDPEVLEREHAPIFSRTWQLGGHVCDVARSGPLHHRPRRRRVRARRPRRGRRAARLPQRLPPPRRPPARRARRLRQGHPLPVPRLDLPHGRHRSSACRRGAASPAWTSASWASCRRGWTRSAGCVFVNLDLGGGAGVAGAGRPGRAPRAVPAPAAAPLRRGAHRAAGQLEDRGRELPGGLPRPDRPPGPDAAARLPALHGRGGGGLRRSSSRRCARSRRATGWSAPTSGSCSRCRG